MKVAWLHSIRTRILATTTLLIVAVVGAVVASGTREVKELYHTEKRQEAKLLAVTLSNSLANELVANNWRGMSLVLHHQLKDNPELVYMLVADVQLANQIVAAAPEEFQGQYIPDMVQLAVTEKALEADKDIPIQETVVLRDINFYPDRQQVRRGEVIIDVAAAIYNDAGDKVGTLRIGLSSQRISQGANRIVHKALLVGGLGLAVGLAGVCWLARWLSYPIRRLQDSAVKIANGDWYHRAEINRADEIGALATAFNEMSASLQGMFDRHQKTLQSFERFVPDKFLKVIASDGIENIQVGVAVTRTVTILFADIRGYTSMSEKMTAQETFEMLNEYLACMGEVIEASGGFIDKYIGDAIMALFEDETTGCALHAALGMQQRLMEFNEERLLKKLPTIAIGIGIHRGEVVMGTVGYRSRMDSTVIGDTVNVAARVEGLTRNYDRSILVTEFVVEALENLEEFELRLVDESVRVKGKSDGVGIYELVAFSPTSPIDYKSNGTEEDLQEYHYYLSVNPVSIDSRHPRSAGDY